MIKRSQFLLNQTVNAGTVALVRGSNAIVGTNTAWTTALIGRQFRAGITSPIYTITSVADATHLTIDMVWGGLTNASVGYEIYNVYVTVPSDFHSFITIWDPNFNWQLWRTITTEELNSWDAQRAQTGTGWSVVASDYDTTVAGPPLPRYEVWPHQKSNYVYPFLYEARATDLDDTGASLPRYIRGDMLLEMALAECARWPGPSTDAPNPYFNLQLAMAHDARSEYMINQAEVQDDEVWETDIRMAAATGLPFAPIPMFDAKWLQTHA